MNSTIPNAVKGYKTERTAKARIEREAEWLAANPDMRMGITRDEDSGEFVVWLRKVEQPTAGQFMVVSMGTRTQHAAAAGADDATTLCGKAGAVRNYSFEFAGPNDIAGMVGTGFCKSCAKRLEIAGRIEIPGVAADEIEVEILEPVTVEVVRDAANSDAALCEAIAKASPREIGTIRTAEGLLMAPEAARAGIRREATKEMNMTGGTYSDAVWGGVMRYEPQSAQEAEYMRAAADAAGYPERVAALTAKRDALAAEFDSVAEFDVENVPAFEAEHVEPIAAGNAAMPRLFDGRFPITTGRNGDAFHVSMDCRVAKRGQVLPLTADRIAACPPCGTCKPLHSSATPLTARVAAHKAVRASRGPVGAQQPRVRAEQPSLVTVRSMSNFEYMAANATTESARAFWTAKADAAAGRK